MAAFIEKLPPSWRDFKNYLKHKRKELSLEDLIVRLRIEEDNRLSEKKVGKNIEVSKANVVEQGSKPNKKRKMPSKCREGFNQGRWQVLQLWQVWTSSQRLQSQEMTENAGQYGGKDLQWC